MGNAEEHPKNEEIENAASKETEDKQNPYCALTSKDIFLLKMSWKGIKRSEEETGLYIFTKLFEQNPDAKLFFGKFKEMDLDTLLKSDKLIDHAVTVMENFENVIIGFADADKTHQMLKDLGSAHKKHGLTDKNIQEIRNPFLKAIENTLADRYSERIRNIYEMFIDYVVKTMCEGLNS